MALYEFRCNDCGLFEEWRAIADRANPAHCPTCTQTAQRVFSSQGLISLSRPLRTPSGQPEPKLVRRDPEPKEQRLKSHPGSRPWMVTH